MEGMTSLSSMRSSSVGKEMPMSHRSQKPSEINGTPIVIKGPETQKPKHLRFLRYEMRGATVHIVSLFDGAEKTMIVAPSGENSFTLSIGK